MALLSTGFEGTTLGATLTATNGGTGNDNFALGTYAGAPSVTYVSTGAVHGTRGVRVTGGSGDQARFYYAGTANTNFAVRFYYRPYAAPTSVGDMWGILETSFSTRVSLRHSTTNLLTLVDAAATTFAIPSAPTMVVDGSVAYRVEIYGTLAATPTTTNGVITAKVFIGDSTTATGTYTSTTFNMLGAGATAWVRQQFGKSTASSVGIDFVLDDIAANIGSATPIGPYVTVNTPPTVAADLAYVEPYSTVSLIGTAGSGPTPTWSQTGGSPTVTLGGSGLTRTFVAPALRAATNLTFTLSDGTLTASQVVGLAPHNQWYVDAAGVEKAARWLPASDFATAVAIAASLAPTPALATTRALAPVVSGSSASSGLVAMPVGNMTNSLGSWTQDFTQDFTTAAALGTVGSVYDSGVLGYSGYNDTSGNGTYTPNSVLSVLTGISGANGVLDYYLHTETIGGTARPRVAAPVIENYRRRFYGRFSVRIKSDSLPGYKIAFLLWPSSDVWNDGEVDWPECSNLSTGTQFSPASAIPGSYGDGTGGQVVFAPPTRFYSPTDASTWHVATMDWVPGLLVFYWDDVEVTRITGYTVPIGPMRWTLQGETQITGGAPAANVAGHLQVDWAVAYSYDGVTVLAHEIWGTQTGQDGTAWPTATWTKGTQTGTADFQNRMGRQLTPATAGSFAPSEYLSSMTAVANAEYTFSWGVLSLNEGYSSFGFRSDGTMRSGDVVPNNGYYLCFWHSGATIEVGRVVAGAKTVLATTNYAFSTTRRTHLRVTAVAGRIRVRAWQAGQPEATTWNIYDDLDASPYNTAGKVLLTLNAGAGATAIECRWDQLVVTQPYTATSSLVVAGAFAVDSVSGSQTTTNANTLSWTHVSSGNPNYALVLVASNVQTNSTVDYVEVPTVTFGGTAMTARGSRVASTGSTTGLNRVVRAYEIFNPGSGSQTVTVAIPTVAGSGGAPNYAGESVAFVNANSTQGATISSGTTTTSTGAQTVSTTGTYAANAIVVTAAAARSGGTLSVGSGETILATRLAGTNVASVFATQAATTSASSASWTTALDQGAIMAIPVLSAVEMPTGAAASIKTWTRVFTDEFTGTSLDTTRWKAMTNNINNTDNLVSNVSVSNSILSLQLSDGAHGAEIDSAPYDGAGANGYLFAVNDYVEARVFFPGNSSVAYNWPAWWVSGQNWPAAGEIDIAEGLGPITTNYHGPARDANGPSAPLSYINSWHTYGVHRKSTTADIYWDGVKVYTHSTNDNGTGQALLFNIGTDVDAVTVTGAAGALKVDWVRAWR